jgi:hypothetical protein
MSGQFEFDEKKTAQENIAAFLAHVESSNQGLGTLLRLNIDKMIPLPEFARRGPVRAAFNGEVKKQLDAALAAIKKPNG